jgi:hypothetical protein
MGIEAQCACDTAGHATMNSGTAPPTIVTADNGKPATRSVCGLSNTV